MLDAEARQDHLRSQYVWHERVGLGPADKDGARERVRVQRDFEVEAENGKLFRKLVAENGRPVSAKRAAALRAKEVRAGASAAVVMAASTASLAGEREFRGRKCYVMKTEPKGDFPYRYTYLVDEDTAAVAQMSFEILKDRRQMKAGSNATINFAPNEEGAWLPTTAEFLILPTSPLAPERARQTNVYSDYRKFGSEVTIEWGDDATEPSSDQN